MSKEIIGCRDEFEGDCIGTLEEILEWQLEHNVPYLRPDYYEISGKLKNNLEMLQAHMEEDK